MTQKKIVLVVEDSHLLRDVVKDTLSDNGYTAIAAENGKEGLAIALAEHPDLIILDLIMPVMDGVQMYQKLRGDEWGKDVPVIMFTGVKDEKMLSWISENKLDFFLKDGRMMDEVLRKVGERLAS